MDNVLETFLMKKVEDLFAHSQLGKKHYVGRSH